MRRAVAAAATIAAAALTVAPVPTTATATAEPRAAYRAQDCDALDPITGSARVCITVRWRDAARGIRVISLKLTARDDDKACERFEKPEALMDYWRIDARTATGTWVRNVRYHGPFQLDGCRNTARFTPAVRVRTPGWSVAMRGKARLRNSPDESVSMWVGRPRDGAR